MRARFDWKLHLLLTVLTLGVWGICLVSAAAKRLIWPWRCEHCGWHEPDFRSPAERKKGSSRSSRNDPGTPDSDDDAPRSPEAPPPADDSF